MLWYALVNNEQLGPMSVQELGELFGKAVVNVETFIWRDGMPEWLPLQQVPEFGDIAGAAVMDLQDFGGPAAEGPDEEDDDAATLMIGAETGGQWAGFLDELAAEAPAMRSQPAGPAAAAQQPAPQQPTARQPTAQQPTAQQPTAQQPTARQPGPRQPGPRQPGPQGPAARSPAAEPAISPLEAPPAPVLTPPPRPFAPPELHAPPEFGGDFSSPQLPAPTAPAEARGSKRLLLILAALVVLGGGGAAAVLLWPEDRPLEAGPERTPPSAAPVAVVASQAPAPPPDASVPDAAVPLDAGADALVFEFIDVRQDAEPPPEPDAEPPAPTAVKRPPTPEELAQRQKAREAYLARVAAAKAAAEARRVAAAAAKQDAGKPSQLGRADIQSVVVANRSKFEPCAKLDENAKGTVVVAIRLDRDGSVPFAKVATAKLRGSPAAACIEGALKSLKFREFTGEPMRFNLPLGL